MFDWVSLEISRKVTDALDLPKEAQTQTQVLISRGINNSLKQVGWLHEDTGIVAIQEPKPEFGTWVPMFKLEEGG